MENESFRLQLSVPVFLLHIVVVAHVHSLYVHRRAVSIDKKKKKKKEQKEEEEEEEEEEKQKKQKKKSRRRRRGG
ncbi:hypothetical protein V1478_011958 [Vespula squamosa]|uniref:Uncharacterized protein n=1 Tax=Vespula squamosa TaxID=30214 RepID=A0ABD2ABU9_VESSQ